MGMVKKLIPVLFSILVVFGLLGCEAPCAEDEMPNFSGKPRVEDLQRAKWVPKTLEVRQAPTGNALAPLVTDGWQNAVNWPQPGAAREQQAINIAFQLQAGNFVNEDGLQLKVVARIQYGNGNSLNKVVIDIPSNSNIRIPLQTERVIVDLATVYTVTDISLLTTDAPADLWENIPLSQFDVAVDGSAVANQTIPQISVGIEPGGGYGNASAALPQRQVETSIPAGHGCAIPRPSGAVNFQYLIENGSTITALQTNIDGTDYSSLGPNISNKLLTDAYAIVVENTGGDGAYVTLSFDIAF